VISQHIALFLFLAQTSSPFTSLNLKAGDRVVTNGGIYGTIVSVHEDKRTVQLKIAENPVVRVEIARSSIAGLQEATEEKK